MNTRPIAILLALVAASAVPEAQAAPTSQPAAKAAPKDPPKQDPAAKPTGVQQQTYHLTGLFDRDRERDLRTALAEIPGVALVRFDLEHGEATFSYDSAAAFPNTKPDKIAERFDQLLRQASGHMFTLKPASTTATEKLKQIELPVVFVDCRACCLAIHEMLMKQDGVEQAIVSLKDHRTIVTIDPQKTSAETLEAFLKKREVTLRH
jgi:copper chaperone CopZ